MTAFHYVALNAAGKRQKGELQAESARQVRVMLQERGLMLMELTPVQEGRAASQRFSFSLKRRHRLSLADLTLITRQLATLLQAGIPLDEVLSGVAKQQHKPEVRQIVLGVRSKVMEGYGLATAMGEFPHAFPKLYRTTVAAGERSAKLDQILQRLADYSEKQQKIRRKILQALIYPSLMTVISVLVVLFMLIYIVPKIMDVFNDTHQTLPLATQLLLGISHTIINYGVYLASGVGLAGFVLFRAWQKPAVKYRGHQFLLRLPVLGRVIKTINGARFARTFGILHAATVPVLEAMQASASLIAPLPMQTAVNNAIQEVGEGRPIYLSLEKTGFFSPMFIHLLSSGEASGQLESMLEKAANGQEAEVESVIDGTLSLFEPMMILVMGGIVMFIVLAVMLPIFALDNFNG